MTVKQELNQLLYKQQEESYSHISIEEEFAFYRNIANGNLDVLQGDLLTENREHMGILSHNPHQFCSAVADFYIEERIFYLSVHRLLLLLHALFSYYYTLFFSSNPVRPFIFLQKKANRK